jgi:hypothetical protein
MKKIKLWLVRRWIKLLPIEELRDEIFRKAVDDWYGDMAHTMLDTFTQEYDYMLEEDDE